MSLGGVSHLWSKLLMLGVYSDSRQHSSLQVRGQAASHPSMHYQRHYLASRQVCMQ